MSFERMTPCGAIAGTESQWPGVAAYKGIRYATAGRWEYPQAVTSWEGTYDATAYGAACYQPRSFYNEAEVPEKAFYYREFREGERYDYSEDCLFLNVWTPADATPEDKLPVIFYIHGGGFTGGCGNEKHFNGPVWPTMGAVAVTINYRLGPLGFCVLPELAQEAGRTGNYGLADQLCALEWVHSNIAAFGGDPENVTIMGQSAGAMSVQQLCLSPLTKGLVSRAVMSSGGGLSDTFAAVPEASALFPFWEGVKGACGCADLSAFRALPVEQLFAAWSAAQDQVRAAGQIPMTCLPVKDGKLICCSGTEAVERGAWRKVPYLMGSNRQDIATLMLHDMAVDWARTQSEQGGEPSYAWHFERQLPGDDCGAWHSADLWYWFGTLDHCWRPLTNADRELSRNMAGYLVNFARTGNPNGEGLPQWDAVNAEHGDVMMLGDDGAHMGAPDRAKLDHIMKTTQPVGE